MKQELTELEKLRAAEARLEAEIAEEAQEIAQRMRNKLLLIGRLSDCKKMIGEQTMGKMKCV